MSGAAVDWSAATPGRPDSVPPMALGRGGCLEGSGGPEGTIWEAYGTSRWPLAGPFKNLFFKFTYHLLASASDLETRVRNDGEKAWLFACCGRRRWLESPTSAPSNVFDINLSKDSHPPVHDWRALGWVHQAEPEDLTASPPQKKLPSSQL